MAPGVGCQTETDGRLPEAPTQRQMHNEQAVLPDRADNATGSSKAPWKKYFILTPVFPEFTATSTAR